MKKINICERLDNATLRVVGSKRMKETLNEIEVGGELLLKLTVKYLGKQYEVQGTIYFPYIVIG